MRLYVVANDIYKKAHRRNWGPAFLTLLLEENWRILVSSVRITWVYFFMDGYHFVELKEFVEEYVDSFAAWDLILFFYNNPEVTGDVVTLATRLGREEEAVEVAAKTLTAKGILREEAEDILVYAPSDRIAEQIKSFVSALETTDGRLSVLLCVLEKMSKRREPRRKILM